MVRGAQMNVKIARNNRRRSYRVAVVVSKKVSKSAAVRNRIRRRVYEAVRRQAGVLDGPYDVIFIIYSDEIATAPAEKVQKMVAGQLSKALAMV